MVLSEFKRRVTATLEEFFSSGDVEEALRSIMEMGCSIYHYSIVKCAISLSLDRNERERELVSKFLSASYPTVLPTEQLGKGFERVFEAIDDLEIDVPGASSIVSTFVARALVDGARGLHSGVCRSAVHMCALCTTQVSGSSKNEIISPVILCPARDPPASLPDGPPGRGPRRRNCGGG